MKLINNKELFRSVLNSVAFSFFMISSIHANVGITVPNLSIPTCSFPSGYSGLSNIVIDEGVNTDFGFALASTNYTIIISAPANFEFQALTGTITNTGNGDITSLSMVVSATTITLTYQSSDANRTNEDDIITISGLQIRAITSASSGNITRTGGDGIVAGLINTTVVGILTSTLTAAPAITSQPANQSVTTCTNATFAVAATGAGLTYQWQEFNGAVWSNLANGGVYSGVTTATLTLTNPGIGLNTYKYRCVVSGTCSPSATSDGNATVTVVNCAASYCTSNATSTADEEILNVTFGTLNNSSTCATTGGAGSILNEYSNYTGIAAPNVTQSTSVAFSVQIGTCGGNFTNAIKIFIDYNQDGDFADAGEEVYVSASSTSGPHTETGNITIPAGATLGNTRMRIVNVETGVPSSITACGTYTWGETEDYTINIVASGPMVFTSCTTTQALTSNVFRCGLSQQIIGIEVATTGSSSPLTLTQFQINMNGSTIPGTNTNDVTLIHVYYTGTSSTYSAIGAFDGAGTSVASGTISINGSQTLSTGTNYFWIAYDMNSVSATIGNVVDAQCTRITLAAVDQTPTVTSPAGSRSIIVCSPAPGGVLSGLETWVRADVGAVGITPMTAWTNQNATGTATILNGSPNLNTIATSYNYNPYVDFTAPVGVLADGAAANRQFLKLSGNDGIIGINYKALFFAFQLTDLSRVNTHIATVDNVTNSSPANGTLHGDADGTGTIAAINLEAYDITDLGTSAPAGTWQRNAQNIVSNANHSAVKHLLTANCTTGGSTTLNRFLGGQRDAMFPGFVGHVRDWKGPVAELIGYTNSLTATERQKIHSYLSLKYGVTLTSNYLSTSGSTIFTTVSPYNLNIIGIGRDDDEALTQKQSHNDDDTVRIYLSSLAASNALNVGAFSNNISYIITGATSGKLCSTIASIGEMPAACSLFSRIEREWKITRTNITQNFNMDIRLAACAASGSVAVADLRLLVDDDGNFGNGGTTCYSNVTNPGLFTYSNPTITVTGITTAMIPDNSTRFITIGSVQAVTPLPTELLEFDAKLNEKRSVDITWSTASEINSSYYIAQKSLDLISWDNVAVLGAAGNSTELLNYACEDLNPYLGINYYRLKQVDQNGSFEYSDTRVVNLSATEILVLYPNPANSVFSIQGIDVGTKDIKMINSIGQEVVLMKIASSNDMIQFDTRELSDGIYYVQIISGTELNNYKLIVLKNE